MSAPLPPLSISMPPAAAASPLTGGFETGLVSLTLAQDAAPVREVSSTAKFVDLVVPLAAIAAIIWFIYLRPIMREQQAQHQTRTNLKKNDEIVTVGGLVGIVTAIPSDGQDVLIKCDGTRLRVRRDQIREIVPKSSKGDRGSQADDDGSDDQR